MLLGKRVIFLLFMLVSLIIYTLNSFDYNQILAKDMTKTESLPIENKIESFIAKLNEVKGKILVSLDNQKTEDKSSKTPKDVLIVKETEVKEEPSIIKLEKEEVILQKTDETKIIEKKAIEAVEVPKVEEIKEVVEIVPNTSKIVQKEINTILEKNKIIFKRRSTTITKESILIVKKIATILNENENFKVEVAGHTDSRGKSSLNKKLSQLRANSVRKALIYYGVNKDRLKAVGYGEESPLVKDDKNGLSMVNRRVEFNIVGE